jgi:PAS domain-containing protein
VLRAIAWVLLGTASTAAIIGGVRWRRPARVGPWLLIAASVAALGLGDVFYAFDQEFTAEIFYLTMFVFVAAALMQFTRGGSLLVDRARVIDLVAFACSTLLVVWVFIIGSNGKLGKISAADVIGDLLLVGVATRVIMATGRNACAALLLTGACGMLTADVFYPFFPNHVTEIGYIVLYVCWGTAALHPSMVRLTQPMTPQLKPWRGHWAALLGASVTTPPLVLLIESVTGTVRDGVAIALAGALTLTLAITRLADSVTLNSRSLARERGLRVSSAALVAAVDPPSVDKAIRDGITQLMPAEAVHRVVFATDDHQMSVAALPAAATDARGRSWWLDESATTEATLVCPLWLEPLAVARPSGGALAITGRRDVLAATRDALEVLAGQAALALDRISLVEAVGRRDSDLYLRAVIRNTADLMLVIDDDQRIRYASPAVRRLLGHEELSPLATLGDLVHPDDRGQVQILVEATYRDLREDRLVQGFVVTLRDITNGHDPAEHLPHIEHVDELPAWVNRRSAQHKFRY